MTEAVVGSVAVDVYPSAQGWRRKLAAQVEPGAHEIGDRIGKILSDRIADAMVKGLGEGTSKSVPMSKQAGKRSGDSFGGEFARNARTRIEAALRALPEAKIGIATNEAEQKLKDLRAELLTLRDAEIGVDLSAADAMAKIAGIQAALEVLGSESASIEVKVNTAAAIAELAAMRTAVAALNGGSGAAGGGGLSRLTSLLGSAGSGIAGMVTALGPASVVLLAVASAIAAIAVSLGTALLGVTAALAVPIGAAGGGLTIFGILAGKAAGKASAIGKEIDDLKKKAKSLVDPAARKAALDEAEALEKTLTTAQRAFLKAREAFSSSFDKLTKGKTGSALLAPLAAGMLLLSKIMPKLEPIITSVSTALSGLLESMGAKVDGGGFDKFVASVAKLAGPAITTIASIIADIGRSIGALFKAAGDTGTSALDGIADAFERLANYLNSTAGQEKMRDFFQWLKDEGPGMLSAIGNIASAFGRVIEALMRVGPILLDVLGFLARDTGGIDATRDAISRIGSAFSTIGAIITAVYNSMIGPVFAGIISGVAGIMRGWAVMLSALSHLPKFGWAGDAATAMNKAAREASGLADDIRKIPNKEIEIRIKDRTKAALADIQAQISRLRGTTIPINAGVFGLNKADGGYISGPGGPRDDKIPAMLSNGEFVINAASTAKHLNLIRQINADRFADGGQVGASAGQFGTPAGITQNFGPIYQQPNESVDEMAEKMYFKLKARG